MNAGNLAGPLFLALGVLILRQRPHHAMGRLYALVGGLLIAFAVANSWLVAGLPTAPRLAVAWFASWAWAVPPILVGTFGLLLLPDGHLPSPRWRWLARASAVCVACIVLGMPYDDSVAAELRAAMPAWGAPVAEVVLLAGLVGALALILACLAAPLVRMVRGGPGARRQLAPVALAATAAVAVYGLQELLVDVLPVDRDLVLAAAVALVPIGVTVAVLRRGLFDIHRLMGRVVGYGLVIGVLAVSYLGLVLALGTVARSFTGESGDLVVALSTLTVAALFQPLRHRVQRFVDRRFNRSRYDARTALEVYAAGLRDQVDLVAAVRELESVARATVEPVSARVYIPGVRS